jgi:hypothetical protein
MLKPLNNINAVEQPQSAKEQICELTLADLDAAAGGKPAKASGGILLKACCHGEHLRSATIVV